MQFKILTPNDKHCPKRFTTILGSAFPQLTVVGNLDIVANPQAPITGLFCSRNCPGSLILPAFDHVSTLRDLGKTVISGFHSHIEQECFNLLLRGTQPIIICPARALQNMRMPSEWEKPLAENRLLIVSPFENSHKRITAKLANLRNNFVATLSDEIFVIHARSGTRTLSLAVEAMKAVKKTYTINDTENQDLIQAGAVPV